MKLETYSVFDKAIDCFLPPFYVRTKQEALRSLLDAARNPEHQFSRHPEDYRLYKLGLYNEERGQFELYDTPQFVVSVPELLRQLELPLEQEAAQ